MLTRDAILAADDLTVEAVEIPEWGGVVYVRTFQGKARDNFERVCTDKRRELGQAFNNEGLRTLLAILTICDEAGNLLFTEEDAEALNAKSAAAVDRIADVAVRLNRIGPAEVEALMGN